MLIALCLSALGATPTELVTTGASWAYLDDGVYPGASWASPGFDDSAWGLGPSPLGYAALEATTVGYGPDPGDRYVSTWFRSTFNVPSAAAYESLTLDLRRDDGAVVYLNGVEIFRSNLPASSTSDTLASSDVAWSEEQLWHTLPLATDLLVDGDNVLAVELHQASPTSDDLLLDLHLTGWSGLPVVTRGPYLQQGTPDSVVLRWRTDAPSMGRAWYGPTPNNLPQIVDEPGALATEHSVTLQGLSANTEVAYAVGTPTDQLAGADPNHVFRTSPLPGTVQPVRIWALGDSGTANASAEAVRLGYQSFVGPQRADVWLMLGDNAYPSGTDDNYQAAVFDMYTDTLPNTVLWPTLGNHDGYSASSLTQTGPYYDIFSLPTQGQAGGEPSGTEAYYSFDYGNIHFVCLDSQDSDRSPTGAMLTWLADDLLTTSADWVIAFWHHPPYSHGSHNSDVEAQLVQMRESAVPLLEDFGVDLVLSGHSHAYERSYLLDGHYGLSTTLDLSMVRNAGSGDPAIDGAYTKPSLVAGSREGAVYVVAGASGQATGGPLDHAAMYYSLNNLGSMVIDVDGSTLVASYVDELGAERDSFTIEKGRTSILLLTADQPAYEAVPVSLDAYAEEPTGQEVASYSWDFDDGSPAASGSAVTHTWANDGVYTVTLTATEAGGGVVSRSVPVVVTNAVPIIDSLDHDPALEGDPTAFWATAHDLAGDPITYRWDFGDGTGLGYGANVDHIFTSDGLYEVSLTVTDDSGGAVTERISVSVLDQPIGDQSVNVSPAEEGRLTTLTAGADPEATAWSWDFHDGLPPRSGQVVEYTWADDGVFPVTLSVADAEGSQTVLTLDVLVSNVAPYDLQLSAPLSGPEGTPLPFALSATDPGDDPLLVTWTFGDLGLPGFGAVASHAYNDDGDYVITANVSDGDGGVNEISLLVEITNQPPQLGLVQGPTVLEEGVTADFVSEGSDPGSADVLTTTWRFPDGTAEGSSTQWSFPTPGLQRVTVTLVDDEGAQDSAELTVEVLSRPPVITSSPPLTATPGDAYRYKVQAQDPGGQALFYTLVGPEGAAVDEQGVVTWRPGHQSGTSDFLLTVSDGTEQVAQDWRVEVGTEISPVVTLREADRGCGCAGGGTAPRWVWVAGLLLFARRRP